MWKVLGTSVCPRAQCDWNARAKPQRQKENREHVSFFFSHQITEKQISKAGRRPHLCSFQRQTLIETWGGDDHAFSGWWTERVCSHSLHWWIQSASSPPLFFPRTAHQANIRGWFFFPLSANASLHLHQHTASEKTPRLLHCHSALVCGDCEIKCCSYKWIASLLHIKSTN